MNAPISVIVVDDEPRLLAAWEKLLATQTDMVLLALLSSADGIEERLADVGDVVVLLDLSMPGRDSLATVAGLRAERPRARVVVYSGYSDEGRVRSAFAAGAWGFVDKLEPPARILEIIRGVSRGETAFPRGHAHA